MSYTIRQFVTSAAEELGYAGYVVDLLPEQLAAAAKRMNGMLAEWNVKGVRLGATLYSNPDDIDLDADSGIPDSANEAVTLNLALRIAPIFGKQPMQDTRTAARRAYEALLIVFSRPIEMQFPEMPSGAGNKPWRNLDAFTLGPQPTLDAGPDGPMEFS